MDNNRPGQGSLEVIENVTVFILNTVSMKPLFCFCYFTVENSGFVASVKHLPVIIGCFSTNHPFPYSQCVTVYCLDTSTGI